VIPTWLLVVCDVYTCNVDSLLGRQRGRIIFSPCICMDPWAQTKNSLQRKFGRNRTSLGSSDVSRHDPTMERPDQCIGWLESFHKWAIQFYPKLVTVNGYIAPRNLKASCSSLLELHRGRHVSSQVPYCSQGRKGRGGRWLLWDGALVGEELKLRKADFPEKLRQKDERPVIRRPTINCHNKYMK
jgi:hypothetical protein